MKEDDTGLREGFVCVVFVVEALPGGSDPSSHRTTSPEQHPLSSTSVYIPSGRDLDIGRVLVRSYRIPNSCDDESPDRQEEEDRVHPAKALLALLMHAYSGGWEGRSRKRN